jgi:23S rRNA (cytosine1962-C5)-methyltransferase
MNPSSEPSSSPPRLKLSVKPAAEGIIRSGHPWVFSDSIRRQNREGEPGELAVIYDRRDRFLAVGFYDPASPLRVRIVHCGDPVSIDADFWNARLRATLARRANLADAMTTGIRLVNGESDGFPGLVLDRYDTTLVLKLYATAWLLRLPLIRDLVLAELRPERLVLRLSRNLGAAGPVHDGAVLHGSAPGGPVVFLESGLRFEADVIRGQKTGFFLDQRENRCRVGTIARGSDVLNAFSFSGGFSLHAARGGAKSVTDLDLSHHALDSARRNFDLNRGDATVAACRHESIQADAFAWLGQARPASYDLVVVDPPSLAKRESERARAIRAYQTLNSAAIRLLRQGGTLVAASCSAHVSADEFIGAVKAAASRPGRRFEILETTGHAPDHHASFPEARYLKAVYLRFG